MWAYYEWKLKSEEEIKKSKTSFFRRKEGSSENEGEKLVENQECLMNVVRAILTG